MKKVVIIIIIIMINFAYSVEAKASPTADFQADNTCLSDTTWFHNASTNYDYLHWDFGDGTDTYTYPSNPNPFHIYETTGDFTVTLTAYAENQTPAVAQKIVTVLPIPELSITPSENVEIYVGGLVTITATSNFNNFTWYRNLTEVLGTNSSIQVGKTGYYSVEVLSGGNCKATKGIYVSVKDSIEQIPEIVVVNNILTPANFDGLNDYLIIENLSLYEHPCQLYIYNTWGSLIYTSTNYNNDWNGVSSEGKELSAGTYYYIIKSEEKKGKAGYIDILR